MLSGATLSKEDSALLFALRTRLSTTPPQRSQNSSGDNSMFDDLEKENTEKQSLTCKNQNFQIEPAGGGWTVRNSSTHTVRPPAEAILSEVLHTFHTADLVYV